MVALVRWALAVLWIWASQASAAWVVTDDTGQRLSFAQPPQRIVSLLPSLTEAVCALDRCNLLVGVDRYSNYPESVRALPQMGGGLDPSIEAIVARRPDVVLAAVNSRFADRLRALGIRVLLLDPQNHADVRRILDTLGQLLAVPDAQRVWREIEAGTASAARSLKPSARAARVYVEVGSGPFAASESSFIGETLARLGVRNTVPARLGSFPLLNPEYVVQANPDVILLAQSDAPGLGSRPGWARIRAVREARVCALDRAQSDLLMRPGPRMALAAQALADCLNAKAP
jgi:iron complex transport system substrate-binding protein